VAERARRKRPAVTVAAPPEVRPEPVAPPPTRSTTPYLLDFLPLEDGSQTKLARFYASLREGRFTTTRCRHDGALLWPPRLACPRCHGDDLEWTDLPTSGTVYAFSAVLAGAPLGMETDVPFVVGLVDLTGAPLRLFGRIVGRPWERCTVGMPVRVEPFDVPDGRVFYRFRASD